MESIIGNWHRRSSSGSIMKQALATVKGFLALLKKRGASSIEPRSQFSIARDWLSVLLLTFCMFVIVGGYAGLVLFAHNADPKIEENAPATSTSVRRDEIDAVLNVYEEKEAYFRMRADALVSVPDPSL